MPSPLRSLRERLGAAGWTQSGSRALEAAVTLLAVLAALAPLFAGTATPTVVGLALIIGACLELAHGVRRSTPEGRRSAWIGGAITLAMGTLVMQAGDLVGRAILLLLAGWFGLDAIRYTVSHPVERDAPLRARILPALGYGLLAIVLVLVRGLAVRWVVALASAFRLVGTAWDIRTAPAYGGEDTGDTVAQDLGLADNPALADLARRLGAEELGRTGIDRGWIGAFVVTLFGIHLGRMGLDRSTLGIASPLVAVLGDLALALIIAFGVVVPVRLFVRRSSRRVERRAWAWCLGKGSPDWLRRLVQAW